MSVYVDPNLEWPKSRKWPFGSVSHLYADDEDELHWFAQTKLGLKRAWCSDHTQPGSLILHYDLSPGKRASAIRAGAIPKPHEHKRHHYRTLEVRAAERARHGAE